MALPYITLIVCWASFHVGVDGEGVVGVEERPACAYYRGELVLRPTAATDVRDAANMEVVTVDEEGREGVRCTKYDFCFSYWRYTTLPDTNTTVIKWLTRGCWDSSHVYCPPNNCSAKSPVHNTFFCCCSGDMCNQNVTLQQPPLISELTDKQDDDGEEKGMGWWVWSLAVVGGFATAAFVTMAAVCWRRTKPLPQTLPPEDHPASPSIDMDSVKILEAIGQGRFGTAYRAVVDGEVVAVKMFQQHHKASYTNEKYIYSLPLMEHHNLLSYLGGGECGGPDGSVYYGLVLSYCPRGRLSSYLSEHTINWSTFCKVVLSATRGLAHLHSEIRKGDVIKPCISHRDFNTRNLLLADDLTCVVSDLGFAIHTQGSRYYINGEEQHAETSSLTDVGTLRYMAPEVLEGAVNLRDCEVALKQVDIYALGLVLWECAARCHDLYQGLQTPQYMLPFQAEIGLHPTFEQMQVLVARNKARPLFPAVWKDTNPAIRLLKETIEDCWDHDAEARLSAMCVEGRLTDMPTLWDRYKSSLGVNGVSPTLNPMSNLGCQRGVGEGLGLGGCSLVISNAITPRDKETSVSEATVETTIPASPSDPPPDNNFLAKNQLVGALQPPIPPLQPHQGRNPCMERNLIRKNPHDHITVSGNILIDHLKPNDINSINTINSVNLMDALDTQNNLESHGFTSEQLMPLLNGHSNTANVAPQSRPVMPPPTLVPPIPYLQNEVRSNDNQPKRQNTAVREDEMHDYNHGSGKGSSWKRWKSAFEDRLKFLIPRRRQHAGEDEERQEILITPTSSSVSEPPTPLTATQTVSVIGTHLPMQTEVLLSNGGPHTIISPSQNLNTQHHNLPNYKAETEIGIAKLHFQNGFAPVIRSRQGSKDSGLNKSSENSVSFVDSENSCEKLKRPTTLILPDRSQEEPTNKTTEQEVSHDTSTQDNQSQELQKDPPEPEKEEQEKNEKEEREEGDESPPLKKAKQRVKTPRRPLNPRLSLYDDRIMGCEEGEGGGSQGEKGGVGQLDEALSHSLPIYMNSLEQQQQHPFLSTTKVVVSSVSSKDGSAASLRHSKVASTSSSSNSSSNSSRSRASSQGGSQGSISQDLPFSRPQLNPQAIGVL